MPVMDTARRDHANRLLDSIIGVRTLAALDDVTRALRAADRRFQRRTPDPALRLDQRIQTRTIAWLLRARGFRLIGRAGADRFAQAVYALTANDNPSPRSGNPKRAAAPTAGGIPRAAGGFGAKP